MIIEENVSLSRYCTWHVGGSARYFVRAQKNNEVKEALDWANHNDKQFFILGGGANILFKDEGFDGLVIKVETREIKIDGEKVFAEAGALTRSVVLKTAESGLTGMEHLAGIPGTIGGAVRGNAGSLGSEIKDLVSEIEVLEKINNEWIEKTLSVTEAEFSYRNSLFKRFPSTFVILSALFVLKHGNKEESLRLINEDLQTRKEKQPYDYPSAGSVFKNPPDGSAGKLIEESGCKGLSIGGAQVSEKHANFIVNRGGAKAADVLELINLVKDRVKEKTGTILEEEVVIK